MKTSIALIGFMGTGKTVVGKILAARLGKKFVELDALIEKKAGRTIPEIFREEGETGFREREIEATRGIAGEKDTVIACGGGIVLNKINIDRLGQECVIVCLTASPAVILKRTSADEDGRPLLAVEDRARQVRELMKFRRPYYERAAEITVNTSRLSPEAVASEIAGRLGDYESFSS